MRFPTAAALIALASPAVAQTPTSDEFASRVAVTNAVLPPDEAAMKAHVMFLASDALRGREAGTTEFEIAARYVASQFYAAGLRPAGSDGDYLQKVPLITIRAADHGSFAWTPEGGKPVPLAFGDDYVPGVNPARATTTVDAPIAFVGYGIVAPTVQRDDYAGVDVKGRIVLLFAGAPASFNGEERAHFGSAPTKVAIAAAKGAAGVILIEPATSVRGGAFKRAAEGYDRPRVGWAQADGTGYTPAPGTPSLGAISQAFAAKLFGAGWPAIAKGAESNETRFTPALLPGRIKAEIHTVTTPLPSFNVVGLLPGADPRLKDEVVVLSAHLDHIGIGKPDATGDTINNGAEDNAVGVASLIEEAKRFKASGKPPRRSIMFLAVTAEEKGLVGADYFAHHPSFGTLLAKPAMVADVNLDMPIITYEFEDVIAFGAERSTLGPIVRRAAAGIGVGLSPDPLPDEGLFVRSDHYRFVQQGVPSVFLWPGQAGPGKAATEAFLAEHYHKPSDEVWQPALDWAQGVRFVDVNYAIAREIADGDQRPAWNKGDFFGMLYGGYGAN